MKYQVKIALGIFCVMSGIYFMVQNTTLNVLIGIILIGIGMAFIGS